MGFEPISRTLTAIYKCFEGTRLANRPLTLYKGILFFLYIQIFMKFFSTLIISRMIELSNTLA